MTSLGVAVIGAGFWGRNQIRVFSEIPDCLLVAVCDTDKEALRRVAEEHHVAACSSLDDVLRREDVDAVTVCTPTTTHYEIAQKVIEAGKHVLVEKPLTSTLQEAQRIIALAQRNNVFLSVGFIERFNPAVRYLKDVIDQNQVGRVILIIARRVTRWPERVGDIGVTKDSAIHDVDVMRFLLNSEVSHVYATAGSLKHRLEDFSEIMLTFENGVAGFIDANWLTPRKIRSLVVTGSEATAVIDYLTQEVTIEESSKSTRPRLQWEEPLRLELQNFIQSIISGRQPSPSGLDGLRALEVCEAALQSSKEKRVMEL